MPGAPPVSAAIFGYRGELMVGQDLMYLRARSYQVPTGRFTTPDPLPGVPGTVLATNPYPYSDNDPVNRADPLGLRARDADFRFADGAVLRPITVPQLPGFGKVRVGFFIADEEVRAPGLVLGDGDGRSFDEGMGPEDNRVYFELDFGTGRGFIQSNSSCTDRTERRCTPANEIAGKYKATTTATQQMRVKFVIGNSRADNVPLLGRLKISADLKITPIRGGGMCIFGVVSPYPSSEAYYDLNRRTYRLFTHRQSRTPFGLARPDVGVGPCETSEAPPFGDPTVPPGLFV